MTANNNQSQDELDQIIIQIYAGPIHFPTAKQKLLEAILSSLPEKKEIPFEFRGPSEQANVAPLFAWNACADLANKNIKELFK